MCGIAGLIDLKRSRDAEALARIGRSMSDALVHRGPDDSGVWTDAETGVCLAHRRLAIVDLSSEGKQPMTSASGRYLLSFNGEIYNHSSLRNRLRGLGHVFRGGSDTEVMLAAISSWGLRKAVESFVGMFAFALWDRECRELSLVRDRMGEKPLYYGYSGGSFLFGSELKALRRHPDWHGDISRDAMTLLLRHGYIPSPYSIFGNIRKLTPGSILTLDMSTLASGSRTEALVPEVYWSARAAALNGMDNPFKGGPGEAMDGLENLLKEAIANQMVADVPVGAFLSGGIDSSLVVALMQSLGGKPVRTFTIGYQEKSFNEAGFAKSVAGHLGTQHTEMYVTPEEAKSVITELPELYDEPFSDFSQIPTYLVSRMTRKHVTVSLSGDGGDELFFGYHRYRKAQWLQRRLGLIPKPARAVLADSMGALPQGLLEGRFKGFLPKVLRQGHSGGISNVMEKFTSALRADAPGKLYSRFVSHWTDPSAVVLGSSEPRTNYSMGGNWSEMEFGDCMMLLDQITYLPDDILAKVDRAAMANSLESRVPLLDHRVVEFAWSLPMSMKYRNGKQKWLMRELLSKYVPKELVDRPKMGFGVPIGEWLRGELRDWAESLLGEKRLREEGFFDPDPIRAKWKAHLSGSYNWQYHLWNVLSFQAWLENQRKA